MAPIRKQVLMQTNNDQYFDAFSFIACFTQHSDNGENGVDLIKWNWRSSVG